MNSLDIKNISGLKVIKDANPKNLNLRLIRFCKKVIQFHGNDWNGDTSRILTVPFTKSIFPIEVKNNKDIKFLIRKYRNKLTFSNLMFQKYTKDHILGMHRDGDFKSLFKRIVIINLIAKNDFLMNISNSFNGAVKVGTKSNSVLIMEGDALNYFHGIKKFTGSRMNIVIRYE